MTNTYLMGIDYGTESCRVGIFTATGEPVAFAATPYPTYYPCAGWAEQSPQDWWDALKGSVKKALKLANVTPAQIAGISYDATTCTVVAMDKAGQPLRNAIMWMDVRAAEQAARAEKSDSVARLYNAAGTAPATAEWFPFKAAWLRENEREIYDAAYRLTDAPDWLTYQLTGEWSVNINSAALRMYYNRAHGGWPHDFYETIGVGDVFAKIPENVVDLGVSVGTLTVQAAEELGLRPGTPVAQGPADAWAGQIGMGVVEPGVMALITGSSHVLTGQTDKPIHGRGFFGAYTDGVVKGQYTVEGGQVSTGSVMKWFRDNFAKSIRATADVTGVSAYDLLNRAARDIRPGSDGLIVNEYFQGNRTPYTDSKARGVIWGLSLHHTSAHIYHAIQESIAYGTAHNIKAMKDAGFDVKKIVVAGGATNSRDFVQMHADVTGIPFTLTRVKDAVSLGSAMLAGVGAGVFSDIREAAKEMVHEIDVIEPNMQTHEEYRYYFRAYMDTYPQLRPMMHEMVDHETRK